MVIKLIKHELIAIGRVLVFIAIAALLFSILGAITLDIDADNFPFAFVIISFFIFTIVALDVAAWVLCFVRFSKPLFTGEGYMTFSLPATPAQIIWAKMIATFISMIFSGVMTVICISILSIGIDSDVWRMTIQLFGELFELIFSYAFSSPLLIFELSLLGIMMLPTSLLFCYLLLSIGQLATKSRKGVTVLLFFGSSFVINLLSSLLFNPMITSIMINVSPHLALWIQIIFYAAVDVGCFFAVRYILSHKLNLLT
ncbi:MAG: hypothetical protein K2L87_00190 [Clostridiales bacterium]|nr:hypothetical protein [Clostridiales bacterium]